MPRTFVRDIQPQSSVDEVYRIADRQVRANRQGNPYLLMQLQDRTGMISAMRWNVDEKMADRFPKGSYVRVQGTSQIHNGVLQLIVNHLSNIDASQVEAEDFNGIDRAKIESSWTRLRQMVESITHPTLQAICGAVLEDPEWSNGLQAAPAGVKTHHAFPGGLLEHVVSLMELSDAVARHYGHVDRDLLVAGAMLHDIGKLQELSFQNEWSYTDAGQLIGHLVQGVAMIESIVSKLLANGQLVDRDMVLRLEHIIVSHHGELEHGSPKIPMTQEALVFHFLDEMDAKLHAARELVNQDRSTDPWTAFNPTLGRKLLKRSFSSE
jgi:3'-5' exoribonuclease